MACTRKRALIHSAPNLQAQVLLFEWTESGSLHPHLDISNGCFVLIFLSNDSANVVNIVPGDFNGDSIMDIIVVYNIPSVDSNYHISLFMGNKSSKYTNDIGGYYFEMS
jgi:hypothetical protein